MILQGRKNSPQQGSAAKHTSSGSRGFTGSIPTGENSVPGKCRSGARNKSVPVHRIKRNAHQSEPARSFANQRHESDTTTRHDEADSQEAVARQPSTETAELLSERDWQEEVEELRFDPLQSSDDDASPSVFFDGIEDIKVLRATLVKLKIISRERGAGGTLDEINATVQKYIARHDFIRRQMPTGKEPLLCKVAIAFEFFEEELHQWRGVARISKAKEDITRRQDRGRGPSGTARNSCMKR